MNPLLYFSASMQAASFYILLVFVSCFSFTQVKASGGDSSKHSISIETIASDSSSSILPFNKVGNLIVLKARVDSVEGNFILDTGAPTLVLNLTYFRDYPITVVSGEDGTSVAGTTSSILRTSVSELSFGNMQYFKREADVVSLADIENTRGIRVLGLLGVNLFSQCEMIIDFEKNLIYLHRISKKEASSYKHEMLNDTSQYRSFSIDITDNRIMTTSEMEGKKLKLIIDCAAESSILDSRLPDKILETITISRKIKLTGPGDKKIDALYGSLNKMKLGDVDVLNLPVIVTNLENTCFSHGGCVDGVLGFDFLSLHKIGFNFVKRKMYIWK